MAEGGDAAPKRGDDFDYDALMERVDATIAESQGERARVPLSAFLLTEHSITGAFKPTAYEASLTQVKRVYLAVNKLLFTLFLATCAGSLSFGAAFVLFAFVAEAVHRGIDRFLCTRIATLTYAWPLGLPILTVFFAAWAVVMFATASFATSPLPVFLAAWATHSFVLEPLVLWGTYTMAQRRQ